MDDLIAEVGADTDIENGDVRHELHGLGDRILFRFARLDLVEAVFGPIQGSLHAFQNLRFVINDQKFVHPEVTPLRSSR
ncbi:hypothetical protein D3C76_1095460 [compost metagenome]